MLETRSYQPENSKYKFTGKERDNTLESNYDYFGARYYDSRIGRWGGVEPLYDKYLSWTPYQYGLCNPTNLIDVNGDSVFIRGDNKQEFINELNKETESTGLTFYLGENGKLLATGNPNDMSAEIIVNAINNSEIMVNLNLTQENYVKIEGVKYDLVVGMFNGSYTDKKGLIQTSQFFNIEHAKVWNTAGGSSVGVSAFHEIKESFIAAVLFPGQKYSTNNFESAHWLTHSGSDPQSQIFPEVRFDPAENLMYLKNPSGENFPLYNK